MSILLILLCLFAHLVGEGLLQSYYMKRLKIDSRYVFITHIAIYYWVLFGIFAMHIGGLSALLVASVVSVGHAVIDFLVPYCYKLLVYSDNWKNFSSVEEMNKKFAFYADSNFYRALAVEQFLHVSLLLTVANFFNVGG